MRDTDVSTAPRRVLVAIDGSLDSRRVAETGIRIAKQNRSSLFLLHVKELPVGLVGGEFNAESRAAEHAREADVGNVIEGIISSAHKEGVEARKVIKEHEKSGPALSWTTQMMREST